jgi:hypothetical protein
MNGGERLNGNPLADAAGPPQTLSHASCRRHITTFAHPTLDANITSVVATIGAKKRTSGFAAIANSCVRANMPATPDRIREKSPLLYDVASDAGVAAKSELNARRVP